MLFQTFKNHIHNIVTVACKWCVLSASDVFLSKNDNSGGGNPWGFRGGGIWYLFHGIWFLSCVITCSDCYPPLSYQINLLMVINIWGIIIYFTFLFTQFVFVSKTVKYQKNETIKFAMKLVISEFVSMYGVFKLVVSEFVSMYGVFWFFV
jgi:hypothetical protein